MALTTKQFHAAVLEFRTYGKTTDILEFPDPQFKIPVYSNEFWTSKQRAAHSLHEISYRACFKPQLPKFITRLTDPGGALIYDPLWGEARRLSRPYCLTVSLWDAISIPESDSDPAPPA